MLEQFFTFSWIFAKFGKICKIVNFDENSSFSHFSPGGWKMWKNRVFIGEGPRFPSIFRYFSMKKWSKKRSNLMSWQGPKQGRKSGKNAVLPGGGPPWEKRHFARSLPKTLHFFATFPIARNCKFYIPWQPRKPSKFDDFPGVRKHAKLGQNLRFFPIFAGSETV